MRIAALALALGFAVASSAAWACQMHEQTASNGQVVASGNNQAPSTPIPKKQSQEDGKS